ncbi:MAG: hypothetical protein ABIA37_01875 [Candidatus Woesearchaeota archaeon]
MLKSLKKSEKISLGVAVLFLIGTVSLLVFTEPSITGYVPATYAVKDLEVVVIKNQSYILASKGDEALQLTGLLISGKVVGPGAVKVFLDSPAGKKLVYSNRRETGLGAITGFAVKQEEPQIEFLPSLEEDLLPEIQQNKDMYDQEIQTYLELLNRQAEEGTNQELVDYIKSVEGESFNKECMETCALFGMSSDSFKFEFEIEQGTILMIDEIIYSIEK